MKAHADTPGVLPHALAGQGDPASADTCQALPAGHRLEACAHCDSVVQIPPLQEGEIATCGRCGHELERFQGWRPEHLLAICATAWVVLLHVLAYPLVTLDVGGNLQQTSIWQSIVFAWDSGNRVVGWMTFLGAVLLPMAELAVLTAALWFIALRSALRLLVWVLRAVAVARNWNMLAVFLLGVLVALIKLGAIGRLQIGFGLVSTALLVVLMAVLSRLDTHTLWRMAEDAGLTPASALPPGAVHAGKVCGQVLVCHGCGMVHALGAPATLPLAGSPQAAVQAGIKARQTCVRCGSALWRRSQQSLAHCWAYLVTALVFYIPANLLPIMETSSLATGAAGHTILSGVVDLYRSGSVFIAVVVFVASLAVPVIKFVVMIWLLLCIQFRWVGGETQNALMFRSMEFIGQWSMLDVFVVVLLAALVHFEGLMQVKIGPAAWSFGMMVVFTMLAAQHFDPRLLWDAYDAAQADNHAPAG